MRAMATDRSGHVLASLPCPRRAVDIAPLADPPAIPSPAFTLTPEHWPLRTLRLAQKKNPSQVGQVPTKGAS
jgi:hypothetical protein